MPAIRVVSYRNSTSNHNWSPAASVKTAVVSYRNSTSNHNAGSGYPVASLVVSYRNSTSNHNGNFLGYMPRPVVSYRNSTSNHNAGTTTPNSALLYLIEILHQTTTAVAVIVIGWKLYLIEILHQTTTFSQSISTRNGCILSKFYIKPQQFREAHWEFFVVSYRNSTSNHNIHCRYIDFRRVVSYRNSTSNHNSGT